jgi:glucokinase
MDKVVIGVDLGGTIVRAGVFDLQGNMRIVDETPIEAARGPDFGLRKIQELIAQVLATCKAKSLTGIGIGATGPVDPVRGTIHNPFTLPGWDNVPITGWLENAFQVPVTLENDADAAALGEYWQGAGREAKRLYAVTVGTGIGTALIQGGQIYRGLDGAHPEAGHMVLDPSGPLCYCKARGCWESLCAGPSLERQARQMDLGDSRLLDLAMGDPEKISARMIFEAARMQDPVALEIVQQAVQYFSQGILNIATLFVPDVIVLSGGVMRSIEFFLPDLQQTLQSHTGMIPADHIQVLPARLGYYAGLYGGAYTILGKTHDR